jgi:hypothetical protein
VRQRGRGKDAETWGVEVARVLTFVAAVDRHRALDDVQGQEAEDGGQHDRRNAEQLAGLLGECFGHQVEADDPEHEPCREPEGAGVEHSKDGRSALVWGRRSSTCGSAADALMDEMRGSTMAARISVPTAAAEDRGGTAAPCDFSRTALGEAA